MLIPNDLYTVPQVMERTGYTAEQVLQWGVTGDVFFLVMAMNLANQLGPCKVPELALKHFITGADTVTVESMPEVYSGELFGPWTIKRESLRIVAKSWDSLIASSPVSESTHARTLDVPSEIARPQQRATAQDAAIIAEIKRQGHDPVALPRNPSGRPGVRAAIKQALDQTPLFTGETVFKKAWERLLKSGEIAIDDAR
jgi:hypothetical protein